MRITPKKVLFLSDLDGTWLSKDPANRAKLDQGVQDLRDEYRPKGVDLKFGYVTARPPERVAKENLPTPDWTITFNGGRIDQGRGIKPDSVGGWSKSSPLQEWEELNDQSGFSAQHALSECREILAEGEFGSLSVQTIGEVIGNPAADDCNNAAHLCFNLADIQLAEHEKTDANANDIPDIFETATFEAPSQIAALAERLNEQLSEDGVELDISPVYLFHGKPYAMIDVATPVANKGEAVDFLRRREGVSPENLIIAGDGGNDISMMRDPSGQDDGRRAIIVGADAKLREAGKGLSHGIIQEAPQDSAVGVLNGLRDHLEAIVTSA